MTCIVPEWSIGASQEEGMHWADLRNTSNWLTEMELSPSDLSTSIRKHFLRRCLEGTGWYGQKDCGKQSCSNLNLIVWHYPDLQYPDDCSATREARMWLQLGLKACGFAPCATKMYPFFALKALKGDAFSYRVSKTCLFRHNEDLFRNPTLLFYFSLSDVFLFLFTILTLCLSTLLRLLWREAWIFSIRFTAETQDVIEKLFWSWKYTSNDWSSSYSSSPIYPLQ